MKNLLTLDEKNYGEELEEIYRIAVRGIIFKDGKLLMTESDDGELKFPGGGMEEGEDDIQTLIRETLEETGFTVVPETFGDTCIRVHESHKDGKVHLEPVRGDQTACGEWVELPIDRVYGYCTLLERHLNRREGH